MDNQSLLMRKLRLMWKADLGTPVVAW